MPDVECVALDSVLVAVDRVDRRDHTTAQRSSCERIVTITLPRFPIKRLVAFN